MPLSLAGTPFPPAAHGILDIRISADVFLFDESADVFPESRRRLEVPVSGRIRFFRIAGGDPDALGYLGGTGSV